MKLKCRCEGRLRQEMQGIRGLRGSISLQKVESWMGDLGCMILEGPKHQLWRIYRVKLAEEELLVLYCGLCRCSKADSLDERELPKEHTFWQDFVKSKGKVSRMPLMMCQRRD